MFIVLLTLVLLYALCATISAVCVTGYLHMGGPSWQAFLYPLLFFGLSYVSVWFARSRSTAVCGAVINLLIILAMRPFNISCFLCLVYSALWFQSACERQRTREKAKGVGPIK